MLAAGALGKMATVLAARAAAVAATAWLERRANRRLSA
jgi:hypothetical protein